MISEQLTEAFRALRKQGYIARKAFSCCCGCASASIIEDVRGKPESERAKIQGAVFFTKQDADWLPGGSLYKNRRNPDEPVKLFIAFGPLDFDKTVIGKPAKEVGEDLTTALKEAGLNVEWDGDPETRVAVLI